jgi:hypothetical protein
MTVSATVSVAVSVAVSATPPAAECLEPPDAIDRLLAFGTRMAQRAVRTRDTWSRGEHFLCLIFNHVDDSVYFLPNLLAVGRSLAPRSIDNAPESINDSGPIPFRTLLDDGTTGLHDAAAPLGARADTGAYPGGGSSEPRGRRSELWGT